MEEVCLKLDVDLSIINCLGQMHEINLVPEREFYLEEGFFNEGPEVIGNVPNSAFADTLSNDYKDTQQRTLGTVIEILQCEHASGDLLATLDPNSTASGDFPVSVANIIDILTYENTSPALLEVFY